MSKRLFLFAAYDSDNIVDDTLIFYINALAKLGDIVFVMDNDAPKTEIKKISDISHVLHAQSLRHGEYDFGSYKRAYLWAQKNDVLKNYDWVYFVNDSVYGPLNDLEPILVNMEKSGADLIGMVSNHDDYTPVHVQSWFVGFNKKIFNAAFFKNFINNIKHISNKMHLVLKYEVGLTATIIRHGFKMQTIMDATKTDLYDCPRQSLIAGIPFIKKAAISNVCNMCFLYPHLDDDILLQYIENNMARRGVKLNRDSYRNIYDLRFLGIPILRITSKDSRYYKIYLFGCMPILKIVR